ncbi:MAG: hypothetical protein AAFY59_03655 [Pseudomonadota bacterium]
MLTTFVLLIAGCGHDAYDCVRMHEMTVEVASIAECEAILDREMAASRIEYPVLEGVCVPEGKMAHAPLWAEQPLAQINPRESGKL